MSKSAIICVDDEKIVLESLQNQLASLLGNKYKYEMAESVEEAWEVIEELVEDGYTMVLVISDWLMPETKGDQFLIDVHKKFPSTVKVMLTGQADPAAVENAKVNARLDAYIQKPWTQEKLRNELGRLLN